MIIAFFYVFTAILNDTDLLASFKGQVYVMFFGIKLDKKIWYFPHILVTLLYVLMF